MGDSRKAEEVYDVHLRRFLFAEGINLPFAQAKSASGESDVLTDLDTDDPLVCEVKIFDADNRRKATLPPASTRPSPKPATTTSKSPTW